MKSKKKNSISLKTIAVILVVVLIMGLALSAIVKSIVKNSGNELRNTVAVESANFKIDNAMMSYLFNYSRLNFVNTYYSYLSYFGLDTSVSLKKQNYGDQTWFDYFMNSALATAKNYLVLAEGAKAAGLSLDDKDMADIDSAVASLKATAKASGYTLNNYIAAMYGSGVKEKDLRKVMELEQLASKYYNQLQDSYEFTGADFDKYCEENKDEFYTASYTTYVFDTEDAAKLVLAASGNYETMVTLINEYEANKVKTAGETPVEDTIKTAVDKALTETNKKADQAYAEKTDLDKWLFSTDRKTNDAYVEDCTLYIMLSPVARDESKCVNVRHILVETEEEANTILAEWQKNPTEENFAQLANEKSSDSGSNTNGGLYENVYSGAMVDEFDAWIFDEARKAGDAGVVKSDYGYHVMYYSGDAEFVTWQVHADESLKSEAYENDYETLEKAHTVTVHDSVLGKIDG